MKKLIPIIAATILLCFYAKAQSRHKDELWTSFKRNFKTVSLPLEINNETNVENEIAPMNRRYSAFVPGLSVPKFSRMGGNDFYYYAQLQTNTEYTALIYIERIPYSGSRMPNSYILATYDKNGKLINRMQIAGQGYLGDKDEVCIINKDLSVEVKEYKLVYDKDVAANGYDNNKVVAKSLVSTKNYQVNNNGKIIGDVEPRRVWSKK